ncbi:hypothetical protein [Thalassotalea euphylliae]|uniref:Uncharacterized protein n=1 Tax=Thalassotalea euphylliae TaxID=1655234 RepID=A0A3E0U0V4_9GAMM|nr:hypothetical protein [Thalassotalea euphylliae]REL30227.1 hypothetical protein DXX94_05630 [Thalassotalea euphylliae]
MNRAPIVWAVFVAMVLAYADFTSRLSLDEIELSARVAESAPDNAQVKFISEEQVTEISLELAKFEKPKPKVKPKINKSSEPKITLMSLAEQQKQQGVKKALFSGENEYSLMAIYTENKEPFALLSELHLLSGKAKPLKLLEGEKLANYTLQQIGKNHIELVEGDRKVSLQLFLKSQS